MICASLNRAVFIKNLLRYLAEKILLLNTTNFRGDYRETPLGLALGNPSMAGTAALSELKKLTTIEVTDK
tara:strand:+ start:1092 stop:1301 length:210 start_codon:yes stop_codon:yes gene_type:complete